MNDEELVQLWTTLTPAADGRRRIDNRVRACLEARETSLATEWLGVFRIEPFAALGLTAVGAIAILAATPLAWVVRGLI